MAASDPTMGVPTPTGTLQGVAAFSWDGSAWQPSGRAGPSVATPTGVLRGVAAFNGGPAWQPSGRAQPGVATPSGVLDGVAVYTWSGSAWTPTGGTETPSTPSGALRGVAAFNWDGAAWQPAGQAGPSVATPYGVLDGVAMFGWTGSVWAAVGAPSLSLDFMQPGTLDPRITFTRASTGTYFNSAGVMQTAAINAPRWDYNQGTLALNGLLIEESRQNIWLQSADASNAAWSAASAGGPVVPVAAANQTTAPDGTLTAARVVYPAVSVASSYSVLYQGPTTTAAVYSSSIWLKGSVGGERIYLTLLAGFGPVTSCTLTTRWQRFAYTTPGNLAAGTNYFMIGTDLRDPGQTSTPAQTIYVWGGQVEPGAFPTSYIPTTAAAVTRAADVCTMPTAAWFNATTGSLSAEFIYNGQGAGGFDALIALVGANSNTDFIEIYIQQSNLGPTNYIKVGSTFTGNAPGPVPITGGTVSKNALTYTAAAIGGATNGSLYTPGAVTGLPTITGLWFMQPNVNFQLQMSGYMRRVSYWPRALSNAELQAVTT